MSETDGLLRDLAAARADQAEHEKAAEAARDRTRAIVGELKKHHTWAELAELTGMSVAQLQYGQWVETQPSLQRRREGRRVPAPPKPGLSVAEAARRLGVTRPTVYKWVEEGKVAAFEFGGHTRIAVDKQDRIVGRNGRPLA